MKSNTEKAYCDLMLALQPALAVLDKRDDSLAPRIQSDEFYTLDNQIAIDAGYMRLAHVVCDPDSFSAIPVITRPRFRRNGAQVARVAVFALFLLSVAVATLGAFCGMIVALAR
jgi:hypothetical protein